MINKLLCPTDGSKAAAKAVEFACKFANFADAEVIFLDVETATDSQLMAGYRQAYNHEVLDAADEQQHKALFKTEKAAKKHGVKKYSSVSAQGLNIAATIIAFAEAHDCDHLVMGSTGRTGIARILIGSIAADVVSKAHCPVTLIR